MECWHADPRCDASYLVDLGRDGFCGMTNFSRIALALLFCWLMCCAGLSAGEADAKKAAAAVDFYHDIKPILVKHCFACHGPAKSEGGLRLDLRSAALQGGDDGPILATGNSAGSLLIQYVTGKNDADIIMPPKGKGAPLSEQEIAVLKSWIDQGAVWPDLPGTAARKNEASDPGELSRADIESNAGKKTVDATDSKAGNGSKGEQAIKSDAIISEHWAFQPVRHVKAPISRDPWIDTPIDAFVLQQLQSHGLAPNSQASRMDLIRRLSFDLTGLPPSPEDVQRFISDKSADAYEHLVDRMLDSTQYGEHWGRHWLDLARYADSDGFENDSDRPNAYKYRDYVIRSFNEDKPYNQFILEQLAGDELDEVGPDHLVALGFCRNGPTISNQVNEKNRVDEVDDVVATTGSVFLGLTVGCARCHDHKYEPISQHDYYRMFAVFNDAKKDNDGDIMHLSDPRDKPRTTYVMLGGDYNRHGDEVQAGIPAVIDNGQAHFPSPDEATSAGRRLALAHWIADPKNPLTARVIVNRIWMYHFGRGLVNTPSNFGQSGDPPTNLELLDYLAEKFVRGGWKVKPLTKMIVMSAVYRQSSAYDAEKSGVDDEDQWYWRFPVRRLEAEAIRDSILSASGNLNPQMYGPGIKPKIPDSILTTTSKEMWPKVAQGWAGAMAAECVHLRQAFAAGADARRV